ncbi:MULTISPECIES: hypothetical protein [unclassified Stenotrophomonas]|uniref:hypothetical protein n=1 Tax=unclassified Stenotrophomonas TaxID=196198 RepID=UPI001F39A7DA|nr:MULTISPECIES: hypothetical protein [unclassified Stenotrophomonas]
MKTITELQKETAMGIETRKSAPRRRRLAPLFAAMLTLGMSFSTGTQQAQAMTVYDPANWIMNFLQEYKSAGEYVTEAGRWSETAGQYMKTIENWISKLQNMQQIIASPLMPPTPTLTRIPDYWNVAEKCGGGSMVSQEGLMSLLGVSPGGDIGAQQRSICAYIQVLENRKYNETVDVVTKSLPAMEQMLGTLRKIRNAFRNEAAIQEDISNNSASQLALDKSFKEWETAMKVYDQQIAALQGRQRNLTERALKGESNPLGTVIKAAALKTALSK